MGARFLNRTRSQAFKLLVCLFLLAGGCHLWAADTQAKAAPAWSVQWQPAQLVNGSPVLFQVRSPQRLKTLSGKWLDHDIDFVLNPKTKTWNAIAGVALSIK